MILFLNYKSLYKAASDVMQDHGEIKATVLVAVKNGQVSKEDAREILAVLGTSYNDIEELLE